MKKFKSHKTVEAFRIIDIIQVPTDEYEIRGAVDCVRVKESFLHKHNPTVNGYYVRCEDGYESFSPAEAFEGGYTEIGEDQIRKVYTKEEVIGIRMTCLDKAIEIYYKTGQIPTCEKVLQTANKIVKFVIGD